MLVVRNAVVFYGTGSYPPLPKGLQRRIRQIANRLPFQAPCLESASIAYSEHVGVKRQLGGIYGEMYFLYPRTIAINTRFILVPPP